MSNLFITLKNNKMTGQFTQLFLKDKICNKMLKKYKFIYIFSCITLKKILFLKVFNLKLKLLPI